jgi:hypothetical protein
MSQDQRDIDAVEAENERLQGQVAAFREFAESLTGGRECGDCCQPWADLQGHAKDCRIAPLLADTEAVAHEWAKRERLAGYQQAKDEDAAIIAEGIMLSKRKAGQ